MSYLFPQNGTGTATQTLLDAGSLIGLSSNDIAIPGAGRYKLEIRNLTTASPDDFVTIKGAFLESGAIGSGRLWGYMPVIGLLDTIPVGSAGTIAKGSSLSAVQLPTFTWFIPSTNVAFSPAPDKGLNISYYFTVLEGLTIAKIDGGMVWGETGDKPFNLPFSASINGSFGTDYDNKYTNIDGFRITPLRVPDAGTFSFYEVNYV